MAYLNKTHALKGAQLKECIYYESKPSYHQKAP